MIVFITWEYSSDKFALILFISIVSVISALLKIYCSVSNIVSFTHSLLLSINKGYSSGQDKFSVQWKLYSLSK